MVGTLIDQNGKQQLLVNVSSKMSKIAISDLYPVGKDLFIDSEGFFDDLTDLEINSVNGGGTPFVIILAVALLTPQNAY